MTAKARNQKLKDINDALKNFPKVVSQKEAAHRENEKNIKPFMKMARDLAFSTSKRALNEHRDPTKRFSDRVDNYVKYRPSYPQTVMDFLKDELQITAGHVVADIGSGTGIFTTLLLKSGCEVYAVEPNKEMRHAAELELAINNLFHSVAAPAEATTLPSQSVETITVAQAFHWFDREKVKVEFQRILKPGGLVVLLWNERKQRGDPFHEEYEALLQKYGTDYNFVKHDNVRQESLFDSFFAAGKYSTRLFENHQDFNFEGLCGRLLSSSYAPTQGHLNFDPMLVALRQLYDRYAHKDILRISYDAEVYFGKI